MEHSNKIKLLAVDDNQSNLIAMESVFSGSPYQVIEATSGPQAIELIKIHPDIVLVLLDVQMPNMDGFETARRIKEMDEGKDLPIIFITAYYREDPFIRKGYESGAVDYFGKPFDPALLRMKVDIYSSFRHKAFLLKEREQRIFETEELLRAGKKLTDVLERLSVGVLISDRSGQIFQCNDVASQLLCADVAQGNDHYGEILNWWNTKGQVFKEPSSPLQIALNEGKSTHNQKVEVECLNNVRKKLIASASPLVEKKGQIVGAVIILQDPTETRQVEEDFENKVSQLVTMKLESSD